MPDHDRFLERKADYLKAVERLREACLEVETSFVRDSVIQRFEIAWEQAWKLLQLRLAILGVVTKNPRDTWMESLKAELIDDGNAWSELQKMRNLTSHTYDEDVALSIYCHIKYEGLMLFEALAHQVETWT
jgi:nucleotidyltransferase substrate binding protein (TIGR01987 family)